MTRIQESRIRLYEACGELHSNHVTAMAHAKALEEFIDAKLSESAADRQGPVPKDIDEMFATIERLGGEQNFTLSRTGNTITVRYDEEREPEPVSAEGEEEGARAMYEHAVLSSGVQTWELIGNFERSQWIEAFRFARDAGRKEERDFWKPELQDAEKRASKAESALAAAKARIEELEGELLAATARQD